MQELCVEEMLNIVNLHLDGVLACTLDYGGLQVFDSRIGLSKPSFKMNTGKPVILSAFESQHGQKLVSFTPICTVFLQELYTHCSIGEHLMLLGYGDGCMQLIDQRVEKKM